MENNAKKEAIRKAYEAIELAFNENIIYDNGWTKINPGQYKSKYGLVDLLKLTNHVHSIRPKSLQGLENNNGWIRIESEEDLPSEQGVYYVMYRGWETNDRLIGKEAYYGKDRGWDSFLDVTHYQPIVKPEKPIY